MAWTPRCKDHWGHVRNHLTIVLFLVPTFLLQANYTPLYLRSSKVSSHNSINSKFRILPSGSDPGVNKPPVLWFFHCSTLSTLPLDVYPSPERNRPASCMWHHGSPKTSLHSTLSVSSQHKLRMFLLYTALRLTLWVSWKPSWDSLHYAKATPTNLLQINLSQGGALRGLVRHILDGLKGNCYMWRNTALRHHLMAFWRILKRIFKFKCPSHKLSYSSH